MFAFFTQFIRFTLPIRMTVINTFAAVVALKIIADRFDMNYRRVGITLAFFLVCTYLMLLCQFMGWDKVYSPAFTMERAGFSFRPWILGCTFALALPFLLNLHWGWGLAAIPLIWLGYSKICLLSAIIGAGVYYGAHEKKTVLKWALCTILGMLTFVWWESGGGAGRLMEMTRVRVWVKSLLLFFDSPIFGKGLGAWAHEGFAVKNGENYEYWRWAHNEFFQYMHEQGVFAVGGLITWCIALFRGGLSRATRSALTILIILSLFHPVFHFGKTSFLCVLVFAFACADHTERRTTRLK